MQSRYLEGDHLPVLQNAADPALVACAHAMADRAAAATMRFFRTPIVIDNKDGNGGFDPVTAADRAAEQAIAEHLAQVSPDHGLEGEEFGVTRPDARYRWVVDPIDGTRAFITGSPMWGTLIGLLDRADPIVGLMDQPFTGERFWSDGATSFSRRNRGQPVQMRTRSCASLATAVMMTTDPLLFAPGDERHAFERLRSKVQLTRYGGDCYAYALLASGFVDIIVECGLKPYDIVALIPIVEAAGGKVTEWNGGTAARGGCILATGDPSLHDEILSELNRKA
jgi:histidinol phosphatase-like enzyme (inositol monophosphatase family)